MKILKMLGINTSSASFRAQMLSSFQEMGEPLAAMEIANKQQSRTLIVIRDAILPKLMAGEIRLGDAEQIAGRIA